MPTSPKHTRGSDSYASKSSPFIESSHDSQIIIESQHHYPTIHLTEVYPTEHPPPVNYHDQEAVLYDLPYETVERIEHAKFFLSTPMHLHYLAYKEHGGDVRKTRARLLSMLDPWYDEEGEKGVAKRSL
jgi:hypothetical protein